MKYPYIGKWESLDLEFLITGENQGIPLRYRKGESIISDINGAEYKNITREYLANTYGEVESPEHAEFIIELAKNAGFDAHYYMKLEPFDGGKGYMEVREPKEYIYNDFVFTGDCLFVGTGAMPDELACLGSPKSGKKQITIPLPPKADKQESSGWPKIGDEVQASFGKGAIALEADKNGMYIVLIDGCYRAMEIDAIKKPKTPEEELRDELIEYLNELGSSARYCFGGNELAADELLKSYDIKKKPQ